MQTSRLPLTVAVALLAVAAACNSSSSGTTSGGSGGPGGSGVNGSGATGATGSAGAGSGSNTGGNPTASASAGTTGQAPQDPIGKKCSTMGNGEYQSCSTSIDCACPLLCGLDPTRGVDDAGGSICVFPCKNTGECPEIFTSCQNGLCTINICEADGGEPFMGPCDAAGHNDGTCEPTVTHDDEIIGACVQSGTVDVDAGVCDPNQQALACAAGANCPLIPSRGLENTKRPPASSLCPIGYQCIATSATAGYCSELCDPVFDGLSEGDAGGCFDGKDCLPIGPDTMYGGKCSFQGDGGCVDMGGFGELDACMQSTDCECPMICRVDVNSVRHVCEKTCSTTADCDDPTTNCQRLNDAPCNGAKTCYCNYNYCVQTYYGYPPNPLPDAGHYGGVCNYAAANDGICQINFSTDPAGNPISPFGYCEPAGNLPVGATCGGQTCGLNEICAGPAGGPYNCYELCNPAMDGGTGCFDAGGCFTISPAPPPFPQPAGVCNPCSNIGATCTNSSECCDGFCAWPQADAGGGTCN